MMSRTTTRLKIQITTTTGQLLSQSVYIPNQDVPNVVRKAALAFGIVIPKEEKIRAR